MLLESLFLVGGAIATFKMLKTTKKQVIKPNVTSPSTTSFSNTRHQQLLELQETPVTKDTLEIQQEKELNHNFMITIGSLVLAVGGTVYSPLRLLSFMGILYSSRHTYKNAYNSLFVKKKLNIDVANSTVVSLLLFNGCYSFACLPITLSGVRRKLIAKIKDDSENAIIDIYKKQPKFITIIIHEGIETKIPIEELEHNNTILVNAGETIPADGYIINGTAAIDQRILTGESIAVEKKENDEVFALTIVLSGRITILVEKAGEETSAANIGKILNQTVNIKTNMQLQCERTIDRLVKPVLIIGGLGLPFFNPSNIAAFINALPGDMLMIASSINTLNYLNLASKKGILIKDGRTLELLNQVDTVVFDKTGTLTEDYPHVGKIHAFQGYQTMEILQIAATAEYYQQHPIAKAILAAAEVKGLILKEIDNAHYNVGLGLEVTIDSMLVHVGSERFMHNLKISLPTDIIGIRERCFAQGSSMVFVSVDYSIIGMLELEPTLRPEAEEVIRSLKKQDIQSIYIISGDQLKPTKYLAKQLDIDHYFAEVLPEHKAELVERLQNEGKTVCFIGDGINDSIALKKAHVSISLRGASSVATDAAQIILMDGSLCHLNELFRLAREFNHKMHFTYGAISVPNMLGVGSILLLHTGFLTAIMINQIGLLLSMSYSIIPLLRKELKEDVNELTQQNRLVTNSTL